ncbi:unannotated protein [freshwater metagenome]|uniref:Unannotated protein n=1 Tax=freshwater metagenome TaxID=449393 RepID=A0A6J7S732_9ZZZZ
MELWRQLRLGDWDYGYSYLHISRHLYGPPHPDQLVGYLDIFANHNHGQLGPQPQVLRAYHGKHGLGMWTTR